MDLKFIFGSKKTSFKVEKDSLKLNLKSTILDKRKEWNVLKGISIIKESQTKIIFGNSRIIGGIFIEKLDKKLEEKTFKIYRNIFAKSNGYNLCRAWNFIPKINKIMGREEIYQTYNKGRSKAFNEFSQNPNFLMPAATAVDIFGEKIVTVFIATKDPVTHFTNPSQIEPYNYPKQYGVKAPNFARASKAKINNKEILFISGTASIKGHESINTGNEFKQLDTTIENIEIMIKQANLDINVLESKKFNLEKIIYIKNKEGFEQIKERIKCKYPAFRNGIFVHANICREELDIEISLTVSQK